ncbi:MAG: hypothetical protein LBV46_00395, partial [Bacteroidales bacterium]|nr:hypothetical protein [Bacteroidales bacterium]
MTAIRYKLYKGAWINNAMPHLEQLLSKRECSDLLKKEGYLVRNIYDFDQLSSSNFWFVIKDNFGGMEELSSNTRTQVRKALKALHIYQIDKETMLEHGYSVYRAAFERYAGNQPMSEEKYIEMIENATEQRSNGATEFFGCFLQDTGKMIAYSMNYVNEDMCDYATFKAIPGCMQQYYPFYGLVYVMNNHYLHERALKYV